MRNLALIAALFLIAGAVTDALAGPRFGAPPPPYAERPLEAAGCYYYRGRQYCGRYCYTEINGKRYCQRREREAVPQGEYYLYADPNYGMK